MFVKARIVWERFVFFNKRAKHLRDGWCLKLLVSTILTRNTEQIYIIKIELCQIELCVKTSSNHRLQIREGRNSRLFSSCAAPQVLAAKGGKCFRVFRCELRIGTAFFRPSCELLNYVLSYVLIWVCFRFQATR